MATRVGKYKMSKRDSALSMADGGTVEGALSVTGAVTLSGLSDGAGGTSNVLFITASSGVTGSAADVGTGFKVVCIKS